MTDGTRSAREVKAWACLVANALVLPGLGSIGAGRLVEGALQAAAALAGFALTMSWAYSFLSAAVTEMILPEDLSGLGSGLLGLALFAAAWIWGLLTGLRVVRESRQPEAERRNL